MTRKAYPTDLTDAQWQKLDPLIPLALPGGRPLEHPRREILNGIFYIVRGGNSWRMLPHDLPPWQTVYYWFRRWQRDGTWEQVHDCLRAEVRVRAKRYVEPAIKIADTQSVKTALVR